MKKHPVYINKGNFYLATHATFRPCFIPTVRKPDFVSDSGSKYWFTEKGVIRGADHWGGNIATCDWFMKGDDGFYQSSYDDNHGFRCGYCKWKDFIGGEIELDITGSELPDDFDYDYVTVKTEEIKDGFYILYGRKIPVRDYKCEINFDFCEKI